MGLRTSPGACPARQGRGSSSRDNGARFTAQGKHAFQCTATTAHHPFDMALPEQLTDAAVEQAMRLTDDDTLVLPFLDVVPSSLAAHSALGRLLGGPPLVLTPGCPLLSLIRGTTLDPAWRTHYPPRPDSLWAHRALLVSLYGHPPSALGPYASLEWLRRHEDADLEQGG